MSNWKLTVGMEVHVELQTATKLFCGCKNDPFHSAPNTNVCPVCYGLPGALPVLNKKAVEMTVKLGQALKGEIANETFWARKNYFYPDLPKGYQISQSSTPLIENAIVTIDGKDHRIARIHLEEDAGKLMHSPDKTHSLVNYNRAGVPLIEIVTEPDFDSAESAKRFCQELQRILRSLDISQADMEKGLMRCEANISASKDGSTSGTKVEVKNINSFRSVEKAINFEFERQTKALEAGEKLQQETRTWDENSSKTVVMRTKETSADYRYFPEPDLPFVAISISEASDHQLPDDQRKQLAELGIPEDIARVMVDRGESKKIATIFDKKGKSYAVEAAKLSAVKPKFAEFDTDEQIDFLELKEKFGWGSALIDAIINSCSESGENLSEFALKMYGDKYDLMSICSEVIAENPKIVADFQAGNQNVLNALVGKVMAKTKGTANVVQARAELEKQLQS